MMMNVDKIRMFRVFRLAVASAAMLVALHVEATTVLADTADTPLAEVQSGPSTSASTETDSKFKLSGFLSVIGGTIFNGSLPSNYVGPTSMNGSTCPCYTADWANGGVYKDQFSVKPETHAGIQGQYTFTPQFNFVGQVVIRGTATTPNVSWAYFEYKLNENWGIHVGRQRIPLYYYSPFQDIGFAYPWVSPPPEIYGWDATNYNGASLRYSNTFGENNLIASVFYGGEKLANSGYYSLTATGDTDVTWNNIAGADIEVNHGPLTVRGVFLQSNTNEFYQGIATPSNLQAYGIAANLDMDRWFVLSEITQLKRNYGTSLYTITAPAATIGAGLRLDKWTPFINYAVYQESSSNLSLYQPTTYKRASLTIRYDVDSASDIKVQVDRNQDTTGTFGGNVGVVRIGYDRVF